MYVFRSHDGYVTLEDGSLEASPGTNYASQQRVFEDLGKGVLSNAFAGSNIYVIKICFMLGMLF